MEKFTVLSLKEIKALSSEEIKKYYRQYQDFLNGQLKINLRDKAEIEKAEKNKNKSRLNHAMFLIAGEFLRSESAVPFLKELASKTRFTARHTEDLNLLMESKGLDKIIKFTPCLEPKKNMDNTKPNEGPTSTAQTVEKDSKKEKVKSESKDTPTSAKPNVEKAPAEPKPEKTLTEYKE